MDELLGPHPSARVRVPYIAQTIRHAATAGNVILVGCGAGFITARLGNLFQVHLIALLPGRIERVWVVENLPAQEAAKFVARRDRGRGRFAKAYFTAALTTNGCITWLTTRTAFRACPQRH